MSHPPLAPAPLAERLARRAAQYCARAEALTRSPDLTVAEAANALDHLAALQSDLANERQRQSRLLSANLAQMERPLAGHEAALLNARGALTEALLRARPDPGDRYGRVAHGGTSEDEAELTKPDAIPSTGRQVEAISACRILLDLEALRPFLDDEALRHAIARHGQATGRHDLQGVAYAALPQGAHLPCAIV